MKKITIDAEPNLQNITTLLNLNFIFWFLIWSLTLIMLQFIVNYISANNNLQLIRFVLWKS